MALKGGQLRIVQSSMLGSILSNILLVLGCCFIAGGLRYDHQNFNPTMASTMSSLMAVSTASLILPATLYAVMEQSNEENTSTKQKILMLSHGTAIILLVLYVLYLLFQLKTHTKLFDPENENQAGEENDDDTQEGQTLNPVAAAVALVIITILVAVCAEYLVGSIDSIVQTAGISKTFIGLILLPIVGNAAEHVTAVVVAWKNKMDLAIGVAIGSSMQIALLVTPFLVILGWIIGEEKTQLTLHFETFETVVFFMSVLITNYLIGVCTSQPIPRILQSLTKNSGWSVELPRRSNVTRNVHYHRAGFRKSSPMSNLLHILILHFSMSILTVRLERQFICLEKYFLTEFGQNVAVFYTRYQFLA